MQTMTVNSWSDYKTLIANKNLAIQYSEWADRYDLYAQESGIFLWAYSIAKNGGSDQTDFETNYKPTANAPLMLNGGLLQVHIVGEVQVFTNESIRDTATKNSSVSSNVGFRVKTIIIHNSLNQAVTIQCQGSRDQSTWINIGNTFDVSASTNTYQSTETYFPYLRLTATCSVAPTTGNLNAWYERTGG